MRAITTLIERLEYMHVLSDRDLFEYVEALDCITGFEDPGS